MLFLWIVYGKSLRADVDAEVAVPVGRLARQGVYWSDQKSTHLLTIFEFLVEIYRANRITLTVIRRRPSGML